LTTTFLLFRKCRSAAASERYFYNFAAYSNSGKQSDGENLKKKTQKTAVLLDYSVPNFTGAN